MSNTNTSEEYRILDKETYFICPLLRPHRIPSKSQGLLRHIAKCTQTLRVENGTYNGASQHPDCFGVLHWVKHDPGKREQHARKCLTLLQSQKESDPLRLIIDEDEPPHLLERLDKKIGTLCRACLQDVDYEQLECPNCSLINPQILFEHTIDDLKDFAPVKYISKQRGRSETNSYNSNNNNNNNNNNDNNYNKRKSSTRDTQVNHPQKSARGESRSFDGRNRTDKPSNKHNEPQSSNEWEDDDNAPKSSGWSTITRNERQNPNFYSQTQSGNTVTNANDQVTPSKRKQVSSNSNENKNNTTTTTTTTTRKSDDRDPSVVSEKDSSSTKQQQKRIIDPSPPLSPILSLSPPQSPLDDTTEEPPLTNTTNHSQAIPFFEIQPTTSQPNISLQETTIDKEVPPYSCTNIRALSNKIDPSRDPRLRK